MEKREQIKKTVITEMHNVDKAAKEAQQKLKDEAAKQMATDEESHSRNVAKIESEFTAAEKTILEIKTANRESEQLLRKVRHSLARTYG